MGQRVRVGFVGCIVMTIRIDVDDDGKTDAKIPLKWAVAIGAVLATLCPIARLMM